MTPSVGAETRALIACLTLAALDKLPNLSVNITPHTRGKAWLVDSCCNRIWLSALLNADELPAALRDALKVLHPPTGIQRRPVVPEQRSEPVVAAI